MTIRDSFQGIQLVSRGCRAALLGLVIAGCGSPPPETDPEPPQFFTTPRAPRSTTVTADSLPDPIERRVLFIGNSYTQVGDMPGLVQKLARSAGRANIQVEENLQGGATLQVHYMRPGVLEQIHTGRFTHVVLQGRGMTPVIDPASFHMYATLFAQAVYDAGAVPVFFETWAREKGDPVYQDPAWGGDPHGMQAIVRAAYRRVTDETGGVFAPAGDAWERASDEPMPPDLYSDDPGHPDDAGVYLTACVFYDVLSGRRSRGIEELFPSVDRATATRLQTIADRTVFGE